METSIDHQPAPFNPHLFGDSIFSMVSAKKLRVFLIEDAPKIRTILTEVLTDTGHVEVVGYAESELDALSQLRSMQWDLAILDIGLREGNGLGVLNGLKNDDKEYGKRVIFSGDPSPSLRARTSALGAERFFDKAREMDGLVNYVEAISV